MPIKKWFIAGSGVVFSSAAFASGSHEADIFHAFTLEASAGENRENQSVREWDLDGWIGTDTHKLWIKSEGHEADHATEESDVWLMYSRNMDTFWDVQVGLRGDRRPESTEYLVMGVAGLAPYYVETEAHVFVSQEGDVSLRFRAEKDFLFTQRWILQPWLETNLFMQEVKELDTGSGLSDATLGLQLRYEITRRFAPYVEFRYGKLFGETADYAITRGENRSESELMAGFKIVF